MFAARRSARSFALLLVLGAAPAWGQYVAPVTSPQVDATSLKLWLDGSYKSSILDENGVNSATGGFTGNVATWQDRSGNANNATQGTAGFRPTYQSSVLNLQGGVRFDAADDRMATSLNVSAPYSVLAMFNYRTATAANRRAVQGSNNWLIGPYNGNVQNYNNTNWVSQNAHGVVQNQFYAGTAFNTGSASSFEVNGANRTTDSTPTGNPGTLGLGAQGAFAEPLDGDLSEVLVFNKALSQSEKSTVGQYLFDKYGFKNGLGNVATGATVINGSNSYPNVSFNSGSFPASKVVDGFTLETQGNIWLGQNLTGTGSFTLDLGSQRNVRNISMINTHGAQFNDRGTRDFEIWASNSVDGSNNLVGAVKILAGTLSTTRADAANDDTQPMDVFNRDTGLADGSYRYLRFDALSRSYDGNSSFNGVGLNEIYVFEDQRLSNVSAGKPVTASAFLNSEFPGSNITDQRFDDFRSSVGGVGTVFDSAVNGNNASYWLAPDGVTNSTLTINLQKDFRIDRIDLQNTHNGHHNDRGTRDFRIEASADGINFTPIFSGTLARVGDISGTPGLNSGDIPIITYSAAGGYFSPFHATYLRFVAINFYGAGAGLNELSAFGVVPEPASGTLLAFGLCALFGVARRAKRKTC